MFREVFKKKEWNTKIKSVIQHKTEINEEWISFIHILDQRTFKEEKEICENYLC